MPSVPKEIRTYCPYCRKHTVFKVKEYKAGKRRSVAWGQIKHENKTKGYTSKVAGKVGGIKNRKHIVLLLTCTECGKKRYKVLPETKKKLEIKR